MRKSKACRFRLRRVADTASVTNYFYKKLCVFFYIILYIIYYIIFCIVYYSILHYIYHIILQYLEIFVVVE